MPDDTYKEAKELHARMRLAEQHVRTHSKIMIALPKHKNKQYTQLLANANARAFSARSAFQVAMKKLTGDQQWKLHSETYI